MKEKCLQKVANSIYTSKFRYGLQLCAKVRCQDEDSTSKSMNKLQKTQNKLLRFLNRKKNSDKIHTKSLLNNVNMLSVNQTNAQIKLTEVWKALNGKSSSLNNLKMKTLTSNRITRSITNGELMEEGLSNKALNTYQNDASRLWNRAPISIKSCGSLSLAKKAIKEFVKCLPI